MQEFEMENETYEEDVLEIHRIKENDLDEIYSDSSQRTSKFDDNVKLSMINRALKLENEIQDIKLFNTNYMQEIMKYYVDMHKLQTTIKKYTEFDNIKNQVNKHEYEISRMETLKRIEELEKKVALWQECYEESQKTLATVIADKQSIKLKMTDFEKLLEIKKNETQTEDEERALEDTNKKFNKIKSVNDTHYSVFTNNRSTEYKMTTVTKDSVKTNMSNEIKEMLIDEYNIKTDDIDKEYQVERIKHMNERSNTKFTKQDKVLKTKDKHALENVEKNGNYLLDDNISVRKKLKKIHKIQENDPEKISFSSSQKTKKFDDNVKQIVLQKSNKIDIKSDKETVTALKIVKKMDKKQKHEKIGLKEIIKMLNKIIDKNEALLKQKNYSQSDLEKNMKKIRQLINQFLKIYYQYDAKKRLTKYENFNADKSKLKTQLSELEYEMRNIKLHNIRNSHDIFDSHSKINQLQVTTRKFETEFDNVKSQINQHDECEISRIETMKKIEKLEKEVASWKE